MSPEIGKIIFIYVIVNRGNGSKVLHSARKHGLYGGTVFFGHGTIRNPVLDVLALNDIRKEILFLAAEKSTGNKFIEFLNDEFMFYKRSHGIAFTIDVDFVCGSKFLSCGNFKKTGDEEISMYQSVYIIVDRGKGEKVVDAATKAGSKGATIISARGAGVHETNKLFNMDIEPEKEIVLIVLKSEITEQVVASIREDLEMNKPGNGIIFVQNVAQVYGLYE